MVMVKYDVNFMGLTHSYSLDTSQSDEGLKFWTGIVGLD